MEKKEITIEIKHPEVLLLILFLSIIVFLELQVTFSRPIAFGDEGFHTDLARYIGLEREYPIYLPHGATKIDKPANARFPLWNILEGSFYFLLGFHEPIVKFLVPFIVFLTGLSSYLLVKKVFNTNIALITSIIVVTIPSYVTYSVLFYTDILFVFFFMISLFTTMLMIKTREIKYAILTGIYSALSILTKTPGIIIVPFLVLCFFYQVFTDKKFFGILKTYLLIVLVAFLILSTFFLRSYIFYKTPSCSYIWTKYCHIISEEYTPRYKFEKAVPEIGTGASVLKMGLMNYLDFAYGYIWFVPLMFLAGVFLLVKKIEKINTIILLGLLPFFIIFYKTTSGRAEDTARLTLSIVPLIGLTCAIYIDEIIELLKKYHRVFSFIVILLIVVVSFLNFKNKLDIMSQVKKFSPLFFDACRFIKQSTASDSLLLAVYGSPTVYNCERSARLTDDTADMVLSNDINLTLERLGAHGFTHIFVQKFALSTTPYGETFPISFVEFLANNPKHFVKIYENGPSIQQCLQMGGCDGSIIYEIKY